MQSDFGFSNRPHATAGFREHLVVRRLHASVRRAGASVKVSIDLSARARAGTTRLRLRVGRCNSGTQNAPRCDAGFSLPLTFRSGSRTFVRRTVTVPRPGGTIKALAIWIGRPGERPWSSAAYLRLPEQAWTRQAGEYFGISVPREGPILAARADLIARNTEQAGLDVKFTVSADATTQLQTRVTPCDGDRPACKPVEKAVEIRARRAREYRVGASAQAPSHRVASFDLRGPDGESPLSGRLLWPVG